MRRVFAISLVPGHRFGISGKWSGRACATGVFPLRLRRQRENIPVRQSALLALALRQLLAELHRVEPRDFFDRSVFAAVFETAGIAARHFLVLALGDFGFPEPESPGQGYTSLWALRLVSSWFICGAAHDKGTGRDPKELEIELRNPTGGSRLFTRR